MNRISRYQLAALLLIGDAFVLFCLPGRICVMTAAGFAAGSILQLFIALPLARLYDRGFTLADSGRAVRLALLACVLLWGGTMFAMLWQTSSVIYIPYEDSGTWGRFLVGGLIAAVCIYISSSGIKALARSGAIAAGLGALCVMTVVVSASVQSDLNNILRPVRSDLPAELIRGFGASGGLGSFAVLLSFTEGSKVRGAALYFACKGLLSGVVLFTAVVVAGGIMEVTDFPVTAAAQLSQPFPVQRTDSLFMVVFSVFAVFSAAVQASAAEYLMARTIPQLKRFRCTLALIIMVSAGAAIDSAEAGMRLFAAAAPAALLAAPAEMLVRGGLRKRNEA